MVFNLNERYQRQIMIDKIGEAGQAKLSKSRALVIGAGGLGSPVLYYLCAAGVGCVDIIDSDTVALSNLNRQFIHFEKDISLQKAYSAKEKLNQFNSEIIINAYTEVLDDTNASQFISPGKYDIVLACVDNHATRQVINKACVKSKTPLVLGGISGFSGYVLCVIQGISPCYNCVFPTASQIPTGVLGATAGVVGSIIASQAIKLILGQNRGLELAFIDLVSLAIEKPQIKRDKNCPVCGHRVNDI